MKRIAALLLSAICCFSGHCYGELIAYDGFDYTSVGNDLHGLSGGFGWTGSWTGNTIFDIATGSLPDPNGWSTTTGNRVYSPASGSNKDIHRMLASPIGMPGTSLYFSFLIRPEGTVGVGYSNGWMALLVSSLTNINNDLVIGRPGAVGGAGNDRWVLETAGGGSAAPTTIAPISGTTVRLVVRADFAAGPDAFRLYVNPPSNGIEPFVPDALKNNLDVGTVSRLFITGPGEFSFDELRVATTYAEVIPEPSTLVLGGVGMVVIGLAAWRRRFAISHQI
ncbi:MAG: PEP-CTERM sorting domain-containing protein [Planctomycetota bacterium]|nr:PEP-CTERM sorting domain-containing protein [Planctomycetota bacterium]